jgi:ppGpp synthetase/RelA/SpoT-type nucleotidyltranferase
MAELNASQANRLGERLRMGVTPEDLALLQEYRETYRDSLDRLVANVRQTAADLGLAYHIGTRPAKTTRSIVNKLARERTRLSKMQDIAGCGIVVLLPAGQDALVAAQPFSILSGEFTT